MGAFIIFYIVGSIVAIPFLAYHLLRTRRDLKGLRAELVARGIIAPGGGGAHSALAASRGDANLLAQGVDAVPAAPDDERASASSPLQPPTRN